MSGLCGCLLQPLSKAHEIQRECVGLHSRPHKGGREDDSDEEEGSSQPKKQRKPKERKKIAKVHPVFFSLLFSCVKMFIAKVPLN